MVRFVHLFAFSLFLTTVDLHAAELVAGRVVDPAGRPVPRALVRAIDTGGRTVAEVFTTPDGTFRLDLGIETCTLEASLTGFTTASVQCARDATLALGLAPLQEAVVVTANRSETPGAQVGAGTSIFTLEDIERRYAPPVADLLASSPGTMVSRSGGYGAVTSLFVRGGESNHNKVLLDGIPLNEPGGTFDFSHLSSENLERIEIVRGAQSALFGSDAMASVVQLFTRRPQAGAGRAVTVALEGGGYDTWRASAGIRGVEGAFDYSFAAAHVDTNNREPNSAFRNSTLSAALGYQVSNRTVLRGVVRAEIGKTGTPGQTAFGRPDLDAYFDRHDIVAGVTWLQDLSPALRHRATYGISIAQQDSVNLELDAPYTPAFEGRTAPFEFFDFPFHNRNDLQRHYATYQADWTMTSAAGGVGAHLLTGAVDWDGERGSVADVLESTRTPVSRDNVGLTVQHQGAWPRVFTTTGVRLERNESFGTAAAPRVSIAVIARRSTGMVGETRLKASAGRGIKEPTALQTFSSSPFFLGNPDLEPEEARTVDAGIEQRLANDRLRIEATWFDNAFTNIISTRTISFSPFRSQYFNIGRTSARGLELAASAAPVDGWLARAGYTWLDSEVLESRTPDDPIFGVGRPLFRRPRHSGFADLSATQGPLTATITGTIVGTRVDSDFSSLEPALTQNDAYARWDIRASYRLRKALSLTVAADNITNADYMEPLGYRALGRTVRVGVRTAF